MVFEYSFCLEKALLMSFPAFLLLFVDHNLLFIDSDYFFFPGLNTLATNTQL